MASLKQPTRPEGAAKAKKALANLDGAAAKKADETLSFAATAAFTAAPAARPSTSTAAGGYVPLALLQNQRPAKTEYIDIAGASDEEGRELAKKALLGVPGVVSVSIPAGSTMAIVFTRAPMLAMRTALDKAGLFAEQVFGDTTQLRAQAAAGKGLGEQSSDDGYLDAAKPAAKAAQPFEKYRDASGGYGLGALVGWMRGTAGAEEERLNKESEAAKRALRIKRERQRAKMRAATAQTAAPAKPAGWRLW